MQQLELCILPQHRLWNVHLAGLPPGRGRSVVVMVSGSLRATRVLDECHGSPQANYL